MNPHVNDECEKFMESEKFMETFMESLRELQESNWDSNRSRQLAILEYEKKRKAELMEQCLQNAKKNIEFEKRKQPNSNKKETPMEYKAIKEIQAQTIVKKETPDEYKARKELQAQRKVKKETPEEYASRMEYMRGKEQLELEAETQRLFIKAEKQYQNHQAYLERQAERDARSDARDAAFEEKRAYNNSEEGRAKAEKTRNWNTPEAIREREKKQEEWKKHQQNHLDSYVARCKYIYEHKANIREGHFNVDKTMDKIDRNYKYAMSIRNNLYK